MSSTLERTLAYIQIVVPYLPYLWLLGTPITFALLATGLIGAERMRRHGTLITDGSVYEACKRLRASLRISRKVALAVCDRVAQPVLVGIVRPLILLPPAALAGWSPEQLEMVLLHELAHVRRWDNLVNLAQRVIESLLFFHPAVWIASTWVRRDREDCCDAVVVTRTEQPKQYAELLVALASPQPLVAVSLASSALARHPLAGRLRRILKLEDEPMLVSRNTIGLLALAVVAIALVVISGPLRVQGEGQGVEDAAAADSSFLSEEDELEEEKSENHSQNTTIRSKFKIPPGNGRKLERALAKLELSDDASVNTISNFLFINAPPDEYLSIAEAIVPIVGEPIRTGEYTNEPIEISWALSEKTLEDLRHSLRADPRWKIEPDREAGKWRVTAHKTVHETIANKLGAEIEGDDSVFFPPAAVPLAHVELRKAQLSPPWPSSHRERPSTYPAVNAKLVAALGIRLDPETEVEFMGDKRIVIAEVVPESDAAKTGMRAGDALLTIGPWETKSMTAVSAVLRWLKDANSPQVKVHIVRNGQVYYGYVRPDWRATVENESLTTLDSPPPTAEEGISDTPALSIGLPSDSEDSATKEQLKQAFKKSFENPETTETYTVPTEFHEQLQQVFDGIRLDPYGPKLPFETEWNDDGTVQIAAPKDAHELFFTHIPELVAQFQRLKPSTLPLADIAYPSPREGDIAARAWEELGLKIAPATDADLEHARKHGYRGGLKVVGGKVNLKDLPVIMTTLQGVDIEDFGDLEQALNEIQAINPDVVEWSGMQGEQPINTQVVREREESESKPPVDAVENMEDAQVRSEASPKLPFLSLEDQKIADRAYKLLGIELEPLSQEELAVVKHHGFESGLRIANSQQQAQLVAGDLLVGLHVWPVTDFRAVETIFNRDDLAQLNPMKYYVVRGPNAMGWGGRPRRGDPTTKDSADPDDFAVVSGRIQFDVRDRAKPEETQPAPQPTSRYEAPRATIGRGVNSDAGVRGRMVYEESADGVRARVVYPQPAPAPPPATQPTPAWPAPSTTPQPIRDDDKPTPTYSPAPATAPEWPSSTDNKSSSAVPTLSSPLPPSERPLGSEGRLSAVLPPPPTLPTPTIRDPNSEIRNLTPVYRYDGKTFQTWRDTWKHELSTEKRIEAVKALAAFGRAGYAKEAAETILDVAGEYDVRTMENKLHSAITEAFRDQIKFDDWHPLLRERYDADPTKWESIAVSILRSSRPVSDENRNLRQRFLLDIAKHGTQSQNLAFQSLVSLESGIRDEEVKALALERLKSNDSAIYSWPAMAFARAGVYPPEFVDILLHGDDGKQKLTRSFLRKSGEETRPLIEKLLSVLQDKEQAADHLAAIRALGATKKSADSAITDLKRIATNEKADLQLRVAAAVALDQIDPQKGEGRTLLLSDVVGEEQGTRIELMNEEMRELSLPVR